MTNFVCVKDFENHAFNVLPKNALDYYKSGAGQETTLQHNQLAFSSLVIRPRCLRNVSKRDLSANILGQRVSMPIGISPTAMQKMAHPQGEMANARAAESAGTIFIQSTISTSSIEEVAAAAPNAIKWFQLYVYKDRLANFDGEKATKINATKDGISGLNNYVNDLFDASLTWKDVAWLQSITHLPIILKGILTAEDALIAADMGIAGILVSNHGARQVDGTPASIEALPEIAYAVGNRVEVYLDGGIRDGTDVFKALALGARMVFMGRPALWGLVHSGEDGVKKILNLLKMQFDSTMAIAGCSSISEIKKDMVVSRSTYSKL